MRIYLQTPCDADTPPRYYHLFLQQDMLGGWSVVREWGAQGSSGRVVRDYFECLEDAVGAFELHRDQQLRKGYRVVFTEGAHQGEG